MINNIVNTGLQPAVNIRDTAAPPAAASGSAASQSTPKAQTNVPAASNLKEAVSKLNDYVQNVQRNLSFRVDKDSGQTVVKVYDAQTNEVIRQIPSEETLKLAASIDEQLNHFFVQENA